MPHSMAAVTRAMVVTSALVSATPVMAATELEEFQRRVGKSAPFAFGFPDRPKGTCVCVDGTNQPHAGLLRHQGPFSGRIHVECAVPFFNEITGAQTGFTTCQFFFPLPK